MDFKDAFEMWCIAVQTNVWYYVYAAGKQWLAACVECFQMFAFFRLEKKKLFLLLTKNVFFF